MLNINYETIVAELIKKLKSAYKIKETLTDESDVMAFDLDSLDTMDYLFFLEDKYGITIEDDKIQKDGFLVVGNTAKYILKIFDK